MASGFFSRAEQGATRLRAIARAAGADRCPNHGQYLDYTHDGDFIHLPTGGSARDRRRHLLAILGTNDYELAVRRVAAKKILICLWPDSIL